MDCQRIDSILDEHGIAALSATERAEAEGHLERCRRCADAWLSHEMLAADRPGGPRQGLFEDIARMTGSWAAAPVGRAASYRAAWLVGAAAVLVAAVLIAWNAGEDRAPPASGPSAAATQPETESAAGPLLGVVNQISDRRFVAGRDYERLPVPVATGSAQGRIEVSEFFMFWCIHCFEFEPELQAWSEAKPDYVDLVRVPALFNVTARLQAQAFYTAEALGLTDTIREPFYEEIHVRGNPLATKEDIGRFFARFGVDEDRFDQVFESFGVRTKLERAEELNRRYRVSATPSIGVNGKYLTNASMTGSNEAMLEVVDSLVQAEARGLCEGDDTEKCPFR
jgi:protein dithiol oxidoreductase (disulfide-forming)